MDYHIDWLSSHMHQCGVPGLREPKVYPCGQYYASQQDVEFVSIHLLRGTDVRSNTELVRTVNSLPHVPQRNVP